MENRDYLGDDGRHVVKACVRVRIFEEHTLGLPAPTEAAHQEEKGLPSIPEGLDDMVLPSKNNPVAQDEEGSSDDEINKRFRSLMRTTEEIEIDYGTGFIIDAVA